MQKQNTKYTSILLTYDILGSELFVLQIKVN